MEANCRGGHWTHIVDLNCAEGGGRRTVVACTSLCPLFVSLGGYVSELLLLFTVSFRTAFMPFSLLNSIFNYDVKNDVRQARKFNLITLETLVGNQNRISN